MEKRRLRAKSSGKRPRAQVRSGSPAPSSRPFQPLAPAPTPAPAPSLPLPPPPPPLPMPCRIRATSAARPIDSASSWNSTFRKILEDEVVSSSVSLTRDRVLPQEIASVASRWP